MLPSAKDDLRRRRWVWQALSDLFLDEQITEDTLHYIARVVAECGYSADELEAIYRTEVAPAVAFNAFDPAGTWGYFDTVWLEGRILRRRGLGYWFNRWIVSPLPIRALRQQWRKLKGLFAEQCECVRRGPRESEWKPCCAEEAPVLHWEGAEQASVAEQGLVPATEPGVRRQEAALAIRIDCPGCGRACEFADFLAGLTAICKGCGHRIFVPPAGDAITASPPVASSQALTASRSPQPAPLESPEPPSLVHGDANLSTLPEWAIEHTAASLRVGLPVPDIEQRLVARGLAPAVAAAVVNRVLEGRVARQSEEMGGGERGEFLHRALSSAVGGVCLVLAYWFGGGLSVGRTVLWLALPLACIWFPKAIARPADPYRTAILRWVGWAVLALIGGYRVVLLLMAAPPA
jgi:hypothetical protein